MARAPSAPRPRRERTHTKRPGAGEKLALPQRPRTKLAAPQEPRAGAKLATRARAKRAARAAATRAVGAALERELMAPAAPVAREHADPGLACLTLAFSIGALASTVVALALWAGLPSAPDARVRARSQPAPARVAAPAAAARAVIVP